MLFYRQNLVSPTTPEKAPTDIWTMTCDTTQQDKAMAVDRTTPSSPSSNDFDSDHSRDCKKSQDPLNSPSYASQILSIRMLMSGKEVGSIIGKRGENVKKYREESGARINISDGSCPERIVTVTGNPDQIALAYLMMCLKFEDDFTQSLQRYNFQGQDISYPPVTLRLLVPATQCGSIIGKGGCKIKDIRELTGASIQVAIELLPQSSERTVTVSGTAKAISRCIKQLCEIIHQTPLKGSSIPYRPKPSLPDTPSSTVQLQTQTQMVNSTTPSAAATANLISSNPLVNALAMAAGVNIDPKTSANLLSNCDTSAIHLNQSNSQPFVDFSMNSTQSSLFGGQSTCFASTPAIQQPSFSNSQMDLGKINDCLSTDGNKTSSSNFDDNSTALSRGLQMDPTGSTHLLNNIPFSNQLMASLYPFLPGQEGLLDASQASHTDLCPSANYYPPLPTPTTSQQQQQDYLTTLLASNAGLGYLPAAHPPHHQQTPSMQNPLSGAGGLPFASPIPGIINESYIINPNGDHRYELIISNDLIGCIIGRGGNKINEIRQLSLATIKISSCEDGLSDRKISITGSPQCVHMAQVLVMNSIFSRESAEFLKSSAGLFIPFPGYGGHAPPTASVPSTQTSTDASLNLFRQFPLIFPSNTPSNGGQETAQDPQNYAPFIFPTAPMTVQY